MFAAEAEVVLSVTICISPLRASAFVQGFEVKCCSVWVLVFLGGHDL